MESFLSSALYLFVLIASCTHVSDFDLPSNKFTIYPNKIARVKIIASKTNTIEKKKKGQK